MSESEAIWVKDPMAILADGAERGVVVADGAIVELVGAGKEPATAAKAFEARDHVVVPGLINTHHHFFQTLTRAVPAALDRELFPWLKALYPIWARMTPDALDAAVTVAMDELMLSGCTTTTDHHYVFPKGLDDGIDIEIAAAKRLGLRVLLTRGSMNLSERDGGLPPDSVVQDEDAILADSKRLVDRYHERGAGGDDSSGAGAVLAVLRDDRADALDRRSRRQARRAHGHPISPRPRTRTNSVLSSTAAGRSTTWRTAAGSTAALGWRTAFISRRTRCRASPRAASASAIAPAATRRWRRAAARCAIWRRPA